MDTFIFLFIQTYQTFIKIKDQKIQSTSLQSMFIKLNK